MTLVKEEQSCSTQHQNQLKAYLERSSSRSNSSPRSTTATRRRRCSALLEDIAALSDKVSVRNDGVAARKPSFAVARLGEAARISFAGIPMGHEFTSLILALLQTGGHPPKAEPSVIEQIRAIPGTFHFETFISLSCHNCPDVVQALNLMSVLNPGISHQMIDGALFQDEVNERQIMGVPTVC
jgi:alkyl hydroperoxide reductase subunit F